MQSILVFYHIPQDHDDPQYPNVFQIRNTQNTSTPNTLSVSTLNKHFPLHGHYVYRVKDQRDGAIYWRDLQNGEHIEVKNSRVELKATRLGWTQIDGQREKEREPRKTSPGEGVHTSPMAVHSSPNNNAKNSPRGATNMVSAQPIVSNPLITVQSPSHHNHHIQSSNTIRTSPPPSKLHQQHSSPAYRSPTSHQYEPNIPKSPTASAQSGKASLLDEFGGINIQSGINTNNNSSLPFSNNNQINNTNLFDVNPNTPLMSTNSTPLIDFTQSSVPNQSSLLFDFNSLSINANSSQNKQTSNNDSFSLFETPNNNSNKKDKSKDQNDLLLI